MAKTVLCIMQPKESARDANSKRRIIAVTKVEIVEWHDYKHLDWITVRRDDDVLYKFKEGDFHRLRIQDIEDMLLLLRRVEDLQLGVESYQKKLNPTKPDTYIIQSEKDRTLIHQYSDQDGFIYENKDKKNRLSAPRTTQVQRCQRDKANARAMIQAIDKKAQTRRIKRFNTSAGNPVKKILLKLNLSDHRLFKDGGGGS
ncbi:hypothetical protein Tco_1004531 [Tanacetum coccineum]|uniref:Uncharacterized protein n=1 Tax=Tanacetum coccineum TaxID=301880 RepID=A0ABQ5FDG2_9ASTR